MQRKNGFFQNIARFAESKGFYIVLGLCVVAIGVSGYVLFFTGGEEEPIELPQQEASMEQPVSQPEPVIEPEPEATTQTPEPEPAVLPIEQQELVQEPEPTVSVSRPVKAETPDFKRPVRGELQRAFSGTELSYDETMCDWRTHGGADYLCAADEDVCAISDGTVTAVFSDPMKGNCVTLSHGDGLTSTYCCLQTNTTMRAGMEVKCGDPIGAAAGSPLMESAQAAHLHLEVARDSALVDPESLFK